MFYSSVGYTDTASNDDSFPIEINSDTADFNDKTGDATHRGSVVVTQGTRHLTSDVLVIHRDNNGKIDKMVATGNPVNFHAYPDPTKPILTGSAKKINYFPKEEKIILETDAVLTQEPHTIEGPLITYFLNTRVLSSESNAHQRSKIIINPKE